MAEKRERLATDILLDIAGHRKMVEIAKEKVKEARGTVAFWEAHVCSHLAKLRDLHKELSERTGEPVEDEQDDFCLDISPTIIWHGKDERPEESGYILITDDDDFGTAGWYDAEEDYFSSAAGGIASSWEDEHFPHWAYIKDLVPKKKEG